MSKESNRLWALAHPEKMREYSRRFYARNPEKRRAASAAWLLAHPEYVERRRALVRERVARDPEAHREKQREYSKKNPNMGRWETWLLSAAKASRVSRKYGAPTITKSYLAELWEMQNGRCYWSGAPLLWERNSPWKVSLDRIRNDLGYEPGNVRLTSWLMNRARGSLSEESFMEILGVLYESYLLIE